MVRNASRPSKPAAARSLQQLDHQLCFALYSSSLLMTKLYKPVLAPFDLTYPQYLVLLVLWETSLDLFHYWIFGCTLRTLEIGKFLQCDQCRGRT